MTPTETSDCNHDAPASFAAPTGYAVADAVKGLCAAKLELIKCRDSLREQGMWMRFDDIWKQYTAELAAIDARLDALLKPHTAEAHAPRGKE